MNTKFKSSFWVTTTQYIATPIIIILFLYSVNYYFNNLGQSTEDFKTVSFYLPFLFWASVYMIFSIYELRYIDVSDDNIKTKSIGIGDEIINYNEIEWINQSGIGSNWYILTFKYKNKETGKSKIIHALPEMYTIRESLSIFNPFADLEITKFIRSKIISSNGDYRTDNEPSRWYIPKRMFLSFLPFLVLYFFVL